MANQLKMAKIDAIFALHQRQWSIRRIAKELDLHRDTVARHLAACKQQAKQATPEEARVDSKQATPEGAPIGSKQATPDQASLGSKQATLTEASLGSEPFPPARAQASLCEPWRQVILDKLQLGLTAQRIYQDLVTEHGFAGRYPSVRRFVRRLGHQQPLPFRRL